MAMIYQCIVRTTFTQKERRDKCRYIIRTTYTMIGQHTQRRNYIRVELSMFLRKTYKEITDELKYR